MQIQGSVTFDAPPERVWELFNDPEALRRATPGCERLDKVGEDRYEAVMSVGVAAIKGTYKGTIEIRDKEPPHRYRLAIEGSGSPGFVNIDASMEFCPPVAAPRSITPGTCRWAAPWPASASGSWGAWGAGSSGNSSRRCRPN